MASFTSWTDLQRQMRNDLASGSWRTKSYDFDGMRKEFVSPEEFLKMLAYVDNQAADESSDYTLRTNARAGDR